MWRLCLAAAPSGGLILLTAVCAAGIVWSVCSQRAVPWLVDLSGVNHAEVADSPVSRSEEPRESWAGMGEGRGGLRAQPPAFRAVVGDTDSRSGDLLVQSSARLWASRWCRPPLPLQVPTWWGHGMMRHAACGACALPGGLHRSLPGLLPQGDLPFITRDSEPALHQKGVLPSTTLHGLHL